tara:strand:+ start:463 stop:1083 length:621 start_codon:yes stop_codon:yes gene_type:complete
MKGFSRCEKGHMYKEALAECPYCPKGSKVSNSDKTELAGNASFGDKTEIFVDSSKKVETEVSPSKTVSGSPKSSKTESTDLNRTFIQGATDTKSGSTPQPRSTRKLMGWVVSYTNHPMGIDFKIYEGRNFLGTASECDIKIFGDQSISSKHALILCRKNKFWLSDQLSSNGTFLNGDDLDPNESPEIKDGDEIKLGNTVFKFKTSS